MEIVLRSAVLYLFLLVLVRAMGKRELAEMSALELLLLVTMGDLVQQGATQEDMSVTGAILATGTIGAMIIGASYLSFRVPRLRPLLEGRAAEVVRDGRVSDDALQIERLTLDDLLSAARDCGIADLSAVRLAVLEADGRLSFVLSPHQPGPGGDDPAPATDKHSI
jgi:uncharacterized membrane protein YcaP (DUF421 family)